MLINNTYFVGEILVANRDQAAVRSRLDWFISKYEPIFLEKVLGYNLYKALKAGYGAIPADQKWIDLVEGCEYQDSAGRTVRWQGLIYQEGSNLDAFDALQDDYLIVGRGEAYDPANNATTTIIPPAYVGTAFRFYQRNYGQLRPPKNPATIYDEYSVSGNVLTLLGGLKFSAGDTYFYKAAVLNGSTSVDPTGKRSLIANYIYFYFERDNAAQKTSLGVTVSKTENAEVVSPATPLMVVWFEMYKWLQDLICFLNNKVDTYTEWKDQNGYQVLCDFEPVNPFITI